MLVLSLFLFLFVFMYNSEYNGFVTEIYADTDKTCENPPLYLNFHIFDECIPFYYDGPESVLYSFNKTFEGVDERVYVGLTCTGRPGIYTPLPLLKCSRTETDYVVQDWGYDNVYQLYKDFSKEQYTTTFQFSGDECDKTNDILVGWSGYDVEIKCKPGCVNSTMTYCGTLE